MILPDLYHWSPIERRGEIRRDGLQPYCPPTISVGGGLDDPEQDYSFPYICFSPTPSSAWGLSGDMDHATEIEEWDLWQVQLAENDEVHYRNDFGPVLREIRVYNAIPAERLWHVGTRSIPFAEPVQ